MDIAVLLKLLQDVNGCTFASIDAEVVPKPGIICKITGERILLFTNKNSNGYENMVRRRLTEAGKDPDTFHLGELPWGTRVPDSPLIYHDDKFYLQTVRLAKGKHEYSIAGQKIEPFMLSAFGIVERKPTNQGLPAADAVEVRTYALDNIIRIALMGEVLTATKKNILSIKTR